MTLSPPAPESRIRPRMALPEPPTDEKGLLQWAKDFSRAVWDRDDEVASLLQHPTSHADMTAVTAGATSVAVTFPGPEPDTAYIPVVATSWVTAHAISDLTTSGFTVTFERAPTAAAEIHWGLVRCTSSGPTGGVGASNDIPLGSVTPVLGEQGRLTLSGSNLLFSPHNGNLIRINSEYVTIPDAGWTLGTGGLGASTLYYIYADGSGLVASTTTYAVQPATGETVMSGDVSKTLVGLARTTAGTAWADSTSQRFVISRFNRRNKDLVGAFTTGRTVTSAGGAEINTEIRVEFVTWGTEAVHGGTAGSWQIAVSVQTARIWLSVDGTRLIDPAQLLQFDAINVYRFFGVPFAFTLTEGYHYLTLFGQSDANQLTFLGAAAGNARCLIQACIRG